jgi:hypothetical protein
MTGSFSSITYTFVMNILLYVNTTSKKMNQNTEFIHNPFVLHMHFTKKIIVSAPFELLFGI